MPTAAVHRFRLAGIVAVGVLSLTGMFAGPTRAHAGAPPLGVPPSGATWLETMNVYRAQSELEPVTENPAWTAGQLAHIQYMRNTDPLLMTGQYASLHTENPSSPWYTVAGDAAGRSSNIGGGATQRDAIDGWMMAPFHAIGILSARLTQSAFALDHSTALLDVIRGLGPSPTPVPTVLFPGRDAVTYLNSASGELPDPREGCAGDWHAFQGLPIVAMFPTSPPAGTTAMLSTPDGAHIAEGPGLCVQTAQTYNSTDTVYGTTGKSILSTANAVLVIPHARLQPGVHTVNIARPGLPATTWSFTVVSTPAFNPVGSGQSATAVWSLPFLISRSAESVMRVAERLR